MENTKIYNILKENLNKDDFDLVLFDESYNHSLKEFKGKHKKSKNDISIEVFHEFCLILNELGILNKKNTKTLLHGIKEALTKEEEEYLCKIIYEFDKLKQQIFIQKEEIKELITDSFNGFENDINNFDISNKKEILLVINESLLDEIEMKDIIKESSETAFISAIENGQDIQDTSSEVTKKIIYTALSEGKFIKSRFLDVSSIVITQATLVANESQSFAKELIVGAVEGSNEAIIKAIEKFKDDIKFSPKEVIDDLGLTIKEIDVIETDFIKMLKKIAQHSEEPSKKILNSIVEENYGTYFKKAKRTLFDLMTQIKFNVRIDDIKKAIARNANIKESFELNEKLDRIKKEFNDFEERITQKFNDFVALKKEKGSKDKKVKKLSDKTNLTNNKEAEEK